MPGWPVVLGHAAALTSVVVTQVFARLQRLDRAQEEASQDLYANEWQTFRYVTFPNIRTAVLGAGLLVFTLSLDEIAVTFFLIGRQNTLPLQIWGLLRRGITPEVNAAATVIFLISVVGHRDLGQAHAGGAPGLRPRPGQAPERPLRGDPRRVRSGALAEGLAGRGGAARRKLP